MQSDKLKYLPAVITEPELLSPDRVFHVAGRNWSSMNVRRMVCLEGGTVREILIEVLRRSLGNEPTAFQASVWLNRCRCKVDGVEISAEKWAVFKPQAGSFVEFLVSPGKGGGGKNVLSSVLMVAVMVASVFTAGAATAAAAGLLGAEFAGGTIYGAAATSFVTIGAASASAGAMAVGALAGMAVMTLGTYALGKICPTVTSPQQAISTSAAKSSQTYSITGSQNAVNPFGYVPLVLGKYRFAGPLGAKSWTKQVGDDQYFNMLVVWGHPDMTVTDFRIGDTPLGEFKDVTHVFHGSTTGNDLQYFGKSYSENSVGATLKYNEPVTRVVGECDSISVDIYSPAMADVSSGHASSASASFKIEYAPVGTENWQTYAESTKFFAPAQYVDCYTGASQNDAWATTDGTWHVRQSDSDWGIPDWTAGKIQASDPHWSPYPIERYKDKHKHHEWWFRDSWYDAGTSTTLTISAAQTTPLTRTYEWAVPHGEYQVRVTRMSPESNRDTLYNDITWSVMRAVVNQPAFNTPIPICVSELCIRASEQLSGYVDNFNALCCSRLPVYNEESGGWTKDSEGEDVVDETQNPADHLRYLLTSRHALNSPYSFAKVDETALAAFAAYCKTKDYHFDFVCDTEASAWTRWTAAASAGRGAVTTDNDGLFGVTVDNAEKTPAQMFTPRNSWGFSIERSYYTMPHALRVSFYDETEDYKEKEGFIYADGYDKTTATDIVEWNFTGKTRWEDLYKMGRYYLASMRLRAITVTLSTDWEWMMCRRGDVVGVAHDVLMNTFGTARVVSLIYQDTEGNPVYVNREEDKPADGSLPVGVRLDESVHFSEDAAYGIAIRQTTGKLLTYQIAHVLNDITKDMMFANTITEAQMPYIGALASVSTLGSEYAEYLVASISVNSDNSAELALVPWAMPEILEAESGEIPAWEPAIKLPTIGNKNTLPVPGIREIRSDESVLIQSGDALLSQIAVWWTLPSGIPATFKRLYVQLRVKDSEGNVFSNSVDVTAADYIAVQGVEDGREYTVYLRLVSDTGVTSEWTKGITETVIGKTSLPPDVTDFVAEIESPSGIRLNWTAVNVLDLSRYRITGPVTIETTAISALAQVYKKVGDLEFSIVAIDRGGRISALAVNASVTVLPPKSPLNISIQKKVDGISLSWEACDTTWPVEYYLIHDEYTGMTAKITARQYVLSHRPVGTYTVSIQAVDIFDNAGAEAVLEVEVEGPPAVSDFTAAIESPSGIRLNWTAVDVSDLAGYRISGDVSVETTSTTALVTVLNKVGTISFQIVAFDLAGRVSAEATATVTIQAPKTPSAYETETRTDGFYLTWEDCDTTWPIRHYFIEDVYTGAKSKELKTQIVISPRTFGTYTVKIQAEDIFGNSGEETEITFNVNLPETPQAGVDVLNGTVRITWSPVKTSFPIRTYQVYSVDNVLLQETDATFYDIAAPAGTLEYRIRAVDTAGNKSAFTEVVFELTPPEAPAIAALVNKNRDGIDLTWNVPQSMLPVLTYEVVRQWDEVQDGGIIETFEEDYGATDSTALSVKPVSTGVHTFMVRAVDSSGNKSGWGYVDFTVKAPGPAFLTDVNVIDNNVQVYWEEPHDLFFAIAYYNFFTVEDGYAALVGRIDARFASRFEKKAGQYTYQVCPVDVAGNSGTCSQISAQVSQPPDFIFWDDKDSTFNGALDGAVLDGQGNMILPVYPDETWEENILRVLSAVGELSVNCDGALVRDYNGKKWLRLYYLDCGEDGSNPLPGSKSEAWDCVIGDTYFSKLAALRDQDELFRQSDGTFEFLAFQSDETGPMTGDASIYSHWTQTENPCLVQYDNSGTTTTPLTSYKSIAKVGTSYPYGMAISTSPNTLIDGQPYHSNYYGAVGQTNYYNNAAPYLTVQRYAQLWIRIDGTEIAEKADLLTWQQKISGNFPAWQSPAAAQASYVEVVDVGADVPSTSITVTVSSQILEGNPQLSCQIEVSSNKTSWRTIAKNSFQTYASSFRYVRYTFTVAGGMLAISNINYRLDVKKMTDFGSVQSNATDNGDGFVSVDSTPDLYGTWVPFVVAFTDIQSGPVVFCNEEGKTAYVNFKDILHPTGFRVFVLDKNGNRVSGRVSWSAYGV